MKQILLITILVFAVAGIGSAQQNLPAKGESLTAPAKSPPQVAAPQVDENYVIGLEDILGVTVWREPELSAPQVVVRPDGKITLPLLGDIQASGATTGGLKELVAQRLKEFVEAPTVSVMVIKIESRKVSIVGSVSKPGIYPLGAPMTVLELIARAGGLTEYAKTKDIKIVRKKDGSTLLFNYKEVIKGNHLEQNIILENGDMVLVP